MTRKTRQQHELAQRGMKDVPLLDKPPMDNVEALITNSIMTLGVDGVSGHDVVRHLSALSGVWVEHAEIYQLIGRMHAEKKYLLHVTTIRQFRGPPLKMYRITKEGKAALAATKAHYKAVAKALGA